MNRKKLFMANVLGIVGSAFLLYNSIIVFIMAIQSNKFDINTFSSMICAILGIIFCSINCANKKMLTISFIFTGINAASIVMVFSTLKTSGYPGGILCFLGIFALIYSFVLYHMCFFSNKTAEEKVEVNTYGSKKLTPAEEIKKLQELKDNNLISEEEYERRKDEIIFRI